jgi:hypothetical protein
MIKEVDRRKEGTLRFCTSTVVMRGFLVDGPAWSPATNGSGEWENFRWGECDRSRVTGMVRRDGWVVASRFRDVIDTRGSDTVGMGVR